MATRDSSKRPPAVSRLHPRAVDTPSRSPRTEFAFVSLVEPRTGDGPRERLDDQALTAMRLAPVAKATGLRGVGSGGSAPLAAIVVGRRIAGLAAVRIAAEAALVAGHRGRASPDAPLIDVPSAVGVRRVGPDGLSRLVSGVRSVFHLSPFVLIVVFPFLIPIL